MESQFWVVWGQFLFSVMICSSLIIINIWIATFTQQKNGCEGCWTSSFHSHQMVVWMWRLLEWGYMLSWSFDWYRKIIGLILIYTYKGESLTYWMLLWETAETGRPFTCFTTTWKERTHIHLQLHAFPKAYGRCEAADACVDEGASGAAVVTLSESKWSTGIQLGS